MLTRFFAILIVVFMSAGVAKAGVESDLGVFWNSLSSGSNLTGASSFEGQAASYYTFGNLRARAQQRTSQLTTFTLPSVEAGCGGIDLIGGGLSIISEQELVQLARSIVQNAQGFAFDLALETVSPVIAETMKNLRALAQEFNLNNINSCEAAKGLVSSIWPAQAAVRDKVCAELGVRRGVFSTYAASRHKCSTKDKQNQVEDAAAATGEDKEPKEFIGPINIAWDVIRGADYGSSDWIKSDNDLAEFIMSMTGSVIISDDDDDNETVNYLRPLSLLDANNKKTWLHFIIHGDDANELKIYDCMDLAMCLEVTEDTRKVSEDKSISHFVRKMLGDLTTKVKTGEAPTTSERGFINATSLPIYRFINVYAAYSGGLIENELDILSEILAIDLGIEWIEGVIREVDARARVSKMAGNKTFVQWRENLDDLLRNIQNIKVENYQNFNRALQLVDRVSHLETILGQNVSRNLAQAGRGSSGTGN